MVELQTSRATVRARTAGQVSRTGSNALKRAANVAQGAANTFSDFYEEKAAIQNDLILSQAQSDWSANYAKRSKNAGTGFTEEILADYDAYVSEVMNRDGTPERGRDRLQAAFDKYRINLEGKAMQREAAARAAAAAAARADAQRLRANAIVLDNSLMEESIDNATTDAERSLYLRSGLTARLESDPQGVLDSIQTGQWNSILTPAQTQAFITHGNNRIAEIEREAEADRQVEQKAMADALEEELAYVAATGALPADSQLSDENIDAVFEGNPDGAEEVKRLRDNGVMDAENINAVAHATPEMVEETLQEYQAAVDEPGHTEDDVRRLNSYAQALVNRNQRIAEDAAGYMGQNNDTVAGLLQQYQQAEDPSTQFAIANRYVNELNVRYDAMGIPENMRPILPKNMAEGYVAQFNSMGSDVAAQALKQFRDSWGDNAPQVMAELSRVGLDPVYYTAMRYADNPGLSAEIVNLAGVASSELRQDIPDANDIDNTLNEKLNERRSVFEFGAANNDAAKSWNDVASVAERLVYSRVRRGVDSDVAIEDVVSRMFPETVYNWNDVKVIAPEGTPANFARMLENRKEPESLGSILPFDDPRLPQFSDKSVLIASLQKFGVWVNNETGDGAVLMINVDGYLLPIYEGSEDNPELYQVMFNNDQPSQPLDVNINAVSFGMGLGSM